MNKRVILASLLAVSLAGCAADGYGGGYGAGYGGYDGDPYYGEPDYIAPAPVYYGAGAAYYRPGYRYRHGYNPHPGTWKGHGQRPWTGTGPNYVQPSGRPGLQGFGHPNYHQHTPGQRPIRRYD